MRLKWPRGLGAIACRDDVSLWRRLRGALNESLNGSINLLMEHPATLHGVM